MQAEVEAMRRAHVTMPMSKAARLGSGVLLELKRDAAARIRSAAQVSARTSNLLRIVLVAGLGERASRCAVRQCR